MLEHDGMGLLNEDSQTCLDIASIYGYEEVGRCLIKHGANIQDTTAQDKAMYTALIHACQSGQTGIVRILLDEGVKVNVPMNYIYTPKTALHIAVEDCHEDIVRLLLSAGANPNAVCRVGMWADRDKDYNRVYKNNEDPLDFGSTYEYAICYAGKAADGHSFSHDQLVHRESVVRELLHDRQVASDNIEFLLPSRSAPIHLAIVHKQTSVIQILLDKGADINARAGHGETTLHMAIDIESAALVRWLLSRCADTSARSRSYGTPLMNAGWTAHESMVRLLISAKERDSCWSRDLGETLANTVPGKLERWPWREYLVKRDEGDEDGRSDFAKQEAIIRPLVEESADIDTAALHVDLRRLTEAADCVQLDCYETFGTESSNGPLEIPGLRPLYMSAMQDLPDMTRLWIKLGADVDAKDDGTRTPALYEAAARGHEQIVKQLLAAGATADVKGGQLGLILGAAAKDGHDHVAQLLREQGADS